MEKNYKALLKEAQVFCFDVDGVFTNNIVLLTNDGEQLRTANVRDGYAVQHAVKCGLQIVIISGGKGQGVHHRFEGLGVKHIFLGASDKLSVFTQFATAHKLNTKQVCYMGDDIPDYPVMRQVGMACCPADAATEIKSIAHYISPYKGGEGCVRDVLEQALKLKGLWMNDEAMKW